MKHCFGFLRVVEKKHLNLDKCFRDIPTAKKNDQTQGGKKWNFICCLDVKIPHIPDSNLIGSQILHIQITN